MGKSQTTYLELGPEDGLHFEYDPPAAKNATLILVDALTGSTSAWQADIAPHLTSLVAKRSVRTLTYEYGE
ncbi:MAG: hypothetical protein OEN48_03330 [Betaproteobacteria bacterium]|nr:hypothetical protein [Gammaproteobacteria bacterium]MDH3436005.1 hypothetical protein [Betaproteobacteria bacterium]